MSGNPNHEPERQKFILSPASSKEAGLFYSQSDSDMELGTVGHLRIDFGSSGKEFWSTWWPHNGDELNTPEFKAELQNFVNELRENGPLTSLLAMSGYCSQHQSGILNDNSNYVYGYIAESENYKYCLRCTPVKGEYNAYLYIYDKRHQEMIRVQKLEVEQELPELCFSIMPSDGSLICVKRGETGYFKSAWDTGNPAKNREIADYSNERLGVSKTQEEAMVAKSMFGWTPEEPVSENMEHTMGGM